MALSGYNVQRKISCIFQTEVVEEKATKRSQQSYKVIATENLKEKAVKSDIFSGKPSEKVDGTCSYVELYNEQPWLWARLDRKPNKNSEKKFKKYQAIHRAWQFSRKEEEAEPYFTWDLKQDFKCVPANWIPATGVEINEDGHPLPDDIGHTPGWVPVDPSSRQHCWHLQSVDLSHSLILVLRSTTEVDVLELKMECMKDYIGKTMELVGTNVNGNPYKIGTKEKPIHFLIPHGEIGFNSKPPLSFQELAQWFDTPDGQVEGIVWQANNGDMFKCHRHHLGLKWPVENLKLISAQIKVNIDLSIVASELNDKSLFKLLADHHGKMFPSVSNVTY